MKQAKFIGEKGFAITDTRYKYKFEDKTPKNAPNVVYIVLDDLGFAQLGCYGSHIHTPNIDRLAEEGLRYNNFHTTAICSATRASLLTGMNHHSAGVCATVESLTGSTNGVGHIHKSCATLAEILHEYDYGTYAVGKWHLTNVTETTEAGPFDNWPLGRGFDKYYGFLHAQIDQFHPRLVQDNSPIAQPKTAEEGYHLSEDLTNHAISYIFHQKEVYPEKPFFLYLAYGAMHAPHHAPKEYIDRYKGKFDEGWDVIRKKWFARQKELGVIPENTKLTERNELAKAWDDLSEPEKKVQARFMEAFAGFLEYTDEQIGRFLDYLQRIGELDNTIVVFLSDNGASAEGGQDGHFNHFVNMTKVANDPESVLNGDKAQAEKTALEVLEHIDEIGGPTSFNHYSNAWANAGNTPFPWYKMWTYSGGVKDPMIVRYPKLIKDPGAVRGQYHHVSDVTPTVLDIIGIEKPDTIKGVIQKPLEGTSFKYTLEDGNLPDQKHIQYYEMCGNRAIYKDGWKAIVNHLVTSRNVFANDTWELYHVAEDYSESENVADLYPEKVTELERAWFAEAARYDVFPLSGGDSDTYLENIDEPILTKERFETYENIIEPIDLIRDLLSALADKSHVLSADIYRETTEQQGVILSVGNYFGGYSLYIVNNRLKFTFNASAKDYYVAESDVELPAGDIHIEYRAKVHKDDTVTVELLLNDRLTAAVDIPQHHDIIDFVATIGANKDTPVAPADYQTPFTFEGVLKRVSLYVEGFTTTVSEELEKFFAVD